jgi:hypothetical protein
MMTERIVRANGVDLCTEPGYTGADLVADAAGVLDA